MTAATPGVAVTVVVLLGTLRQGLGRWSLTGKNGEFRDNMTLAIGNTLEIHWNT